MENANEARRIGPRSKQYLLWVAAHVISEQSNRPAHECLRKVISAFGDTLKPTDVRGAHSFQATYELVSRRAKDIKRTLQVGGLNVDDPAIIRMLTNVNAGADPEPNPEPASAPEPTLETPPPDSAEEFLAEVFAKTAAPKLAVTNSDDGYFDDLPSTSIEGEVKDVQLSGRAGKQIAAALAYGRYLMRHAKIPLVPYTRPDLGVTFFPTGRFEAEGVDWNYNGQIGGELIRECGKDKLLFIGDGPQKQIIEFKGWSFTRDQKVTGTLWVWAVTHEEDKQMRFWFNDKSDGERGDRVRFYYTMTAKGVTQVLKKPEAPGSKRFVKVAERHIEPIDVDS